eukprot:GHVT01077764.1.p1 GENE.GHVT01077764.1~~GHVT01077764.1.p1  ORF type:complete len:100 (-),score=13.50 GHVT01077764.1:432-731(-)
MMAIVPGRKFDQFFDYMQKLRFVWQWPLRGRFPTCFGWSSSELLKVLDSSSSSPASRSREHHERPSRVLCDRHSPTQTSKDSHEAIQIERGSRPARPPT